MNVLNPSQEDLRDVSWLQKYVRSEAGQAAIAAHSQMLVEQMNTREAYIEMCKQAEAVFKPVTPEIMRQIRALTAIYRGSASPAHEGNHWDGDNLGIQALLRDPYVQQAAFKCELEAAKIGAFHDLGTALIPRYEDMNFQVGHCQIGAWLIHNLLRDIVEEHVLLLACYAIDAHQDLPEKPAEKRTSKDGHTRPFYTIRLFGLPGDDKMAHPVGLAPTLTRYADRWQNLGEAQVGRHIMATLDAQSQVGLAQDFDGKEYFNMQGPALIALLKPSVNYPRSNPTTVFDWVLNVYGKSVFGAAFYSADDKLFPIMMRVNDQKLGQLYHIKEILESDPTGVTFNEGETLHQIKAYLRRVDSSPAFWQCWMYFLRSWKELDLKEKMKWAILVPYLHAAHVQGYDELLRIASLDADPEWTEFARELYDAVV